MSTGGGGGGDAEELSCVQARTHARATLTPPPSYTEFVEALTVLAMQVNRDERKTVVEKVQVCVCVCVCAQACVCACIRLYVFVVSVVVDGGVHVCVCLFEELVVGGVCDILRFSHADDAV